MRVQGLVKTSDWGMAPTYESTDGHFRVDYCNNASEHWRLTDNRPPGTGQHMRRVISWHRTLRSAKAEIERRLAAPALYIHICRSDTDREATGLVLGPFEAVSVCAGRSLVADDTEVAHLSDDGKWWRFAICDSMDGVPALWSDFSVEAAA